MKINRLSEKASVVRLSKRKVRRNFNNILFASDATEKQKVEILTAFHKALEVYNG